MTVLTAVITAAFFFNRSENLQNIDERTQSTDQESLSALSEPQPESAWIPKTTKNCPNDLPESKQHFKVKSVSEYVKGSTEDMPVRYMPGMLRTSQLEKMMSKEELEEEQRVQREQLAAIFNLLKQNQETFGEVTETDMEEQFKLYSI